MVCDDSLVLSRIYFERLVRHVVRHVGLGDGWHGLHGAVGLTSGLSSLRLHLQQDLEGSQPRRVSQDGRVDLDAQ